MLVIRRSLIWAEGDILYRLLVDGICVAVLVRWDESPIRIRYAGAQIISGFLNLGS